MVEIWSDVVCPWCYIGKRRFEAALADDPRSGEVEVRYRSFQLDREAPTFVAMTPGPPIASLLGKKYGGGDKAGQAMLDNIVSVAAHEGLDFNFAAAPHVNTREAHRVLHLAAQDSLATQQAVKESLLAAYFTAAANVGDPEVLTSAAVSAGLEEARVRAVLGSREFEDAVEADLDLAFELGISGVPFYVFDRRVGLSGAQPSETFRAALAQARS